MSLVSYQAAFPWAESIREQLLADTIHPWHDDDQFGVYRPDRRLSSFELDQIIDWASGGKPEGKAPVDTLRAESGTEWPLGIPDAILEMPSVVTLGADNPETTVTLLLSSNWNETRYLAAFDLKPGNASVVHDALVYVAPDRLSGVEATPSDLSVAQLLGTWLPGQTRFLGDLKSGYPIPKGSQIAVRLHYRKGWQKEGVALTDQSKLGLYFSKGVFARVMKTLPLRMIMPGITGQQPTSMEQVIERDCQLKSILPAVSERDATVDIVAIRPDGTRFNLLRIVGYDPGWPVRYDFPEPVYLPMGTRVKVATSFVNDGVRGAKRGVTVWFDYLED